MTAPIIDSHAHIYRTDMPLAETAWHRPPCSADLDQYLQTLDNAGVHFAVLAAASLYGDYNDYMLEAVRRHDRLRATVIVAPDIDPYVLKQMDADGAVGIRLQFRNVKTPPDLKSYEYQKLFRRVADIGWHVHLHDEGERLPYYIEAIENAGPRLIIDHFGRPSATGGIWSDGFRAVIGAVERGKTWVKISAGFRLGPPETAQAAADALLHHAGPERLLWGSDWPFAAFENTMTYEHVLNLYYRLVPDEKIRRAIDRTALRFYFP